MATNKKKILITKMDLAAGRALLHARDDIELVEFPNMISQADFNAKLKEHAPVHGIALGGTRLPARRDGRVAGDGGGGAHRRRLRRGGGAGTDGAPRAADGGRHGEFAPRWRSMRST